MQNRYYKYSTYLQEKYGAKTYKLPVNLPLTCPNRDGNLGQGGCAFCGEEGAAFEKLPPSYTVKEQLLEIRDYIGEKYGAQKFIAYFQNFTNTYLPLPRLLEYVQKAAEVEGIVEVSLSTRPDCISPGYLEALQELLQKRGVQLSLELGLQTVNYHTLAKVKRGHGLAEFIDAVLIARRYGVEVGVHFILNLPGDTVLDSIEGAKVVSALQVDTVKLHSLYLMEDTVLGKQYQQGLVTVPPLEEYIEMVIAFLEHLDPRIAVQRLLGRAPKEAALFVNWGQDWASIQQLIFQEMEKRNSYQGKKFNYLGGKALKIFTE